jgi:hypothetical protein
MRRKTVLLAVVALTLVGCSEDSLIDLGGRSSGWIGTPEEVSEQEEATGSQYVDVLDVGWSNDELGMPAPDGNSASVVAAVVKRNEGPERYLQASRFEISAALPGMQFPAVLPDEVSHVTSQLVVAPTRDRLDSDVFAAFGLWTVEPYTKSRSVGQRGTLLVGAAQPGDPCDRLAGGAIQTCSPARVAGVDAVRIDSESGQTWVWADDAYEYQLFLRGAIETNEPAVLEMVGAEIQFAEVAGTAVLGARVTQPEQ